MSLGDRRLKNRPRNAANQGSQQAVRVAASLEIRAHAVMRPVEKCGRHAPVEELANCLRLDVVIVMALRPTGWASIRLVRQNAHWHEMLSVRETRSNGEHVFERLPCKPGVFAVQVHSLKLGVSLTVASLQYVWEK